MKTFDLNLPKYADAKRGNVGAYCILNVGTVQSGGSGGAAPGGTITSNPDRTVRFNPATAQGATAINAATQIIVAAALPMPNNVDIEYSQDWTLDSTTTLERLVGTGTNLLTGNESIQDYSTRSVADNLKSHVMNKLVQIGNSTSFRRALRDQGLAFNPHKEMFYNGPQWRTFTLDWELSMRNANDSANFDGFVAAIAEAQAPDFIEGATSGVWKIPDTFFVEFVNAKTRKYGACVLTGFRIRYNNTGAGWKGAYDGSPMHVSISMDFLEIAPVIKRDVREGK